MAEEKIEVRWRQRFQNFRNANSQLLAAVKLANERRLSDLERQGLIQAFEFTHELAWKTMKDFLESRGASTIYGSKDATRQAFAAGLIADGEAWMEMIESRNRSSHAYNEAIAAGIASSILNDYFRRFADFERRFLELENDSQ